MTIEKAIYQLEDLIKDREACKKGIKALEKEVPKKVIWENGKNGKIYAFHWACCPNCGNELFDIEIGEFKFCPDCGQTLDWSDENEV